MSPAGGFEAGGAAAGGGGGGGGGGAPPETKFAAGGGGGGGSTAFEDPEPDCICLRASRASTPSWFQVRPFG